MNKQAPARESKPVGIVFEWRDVLRVVRDPKTRSRVASELERRGFKPVSLDDSRNRRKALESVSDSLTAVEDWLEHTHPRHQERPLIAGLRRGLERRLWP